MCGVVHADHNGAIKFASGWGDDARVKSLVRDPAWLEEAACKRIVPILLNDAKFTGVLAHSRDSYVLMLFEGCGNTVLNFLIGVDFAWDIVEHILTDPYDAMVVADADAKARFLSPVHEEFFGLKPGEGIGQRVRDIIPNSRLHLVIESGEAEVGQVLEVGGRHRIVSRHPIRHKGEIVGAIGRVMFKGPQQVEDMSRRISMLEEKLVQYERQSQDEQRAERYLDAIIGKSPAIESVRQQIRKIAPVDVPVLIQGQSGTGKELVARALHMLSPRRDARLVTVNAPALPATLVESELFGYTAGSFTGANRKGRPGKFELADGGTIFLDEIGDMPLEVQSKLLRVLQERVVERVGSDRPKRVDFRLCSASNHDLEEMVDQGEFRLDLFYRISPVCIKLPSLDDRLEDIPLLLHHFVQEFAEKYGSATSEIDMHVSDYLMSRKWPGNIRQLRHEIERAFVFSEGGRITVDNFEQQEGGAPMRPVEAISSQKGRVGNGYQGGTIKEAVDRLECDMILDAMSRFRGNKKKVASHLGISRSYLYKKLETIEESVLESK